MTSRKNLWLTIGFCFILWLAFGWLIISVSPDFSSKSSIPTAKIAFFAILLSALTITLSLIFKSTKKALILSLAIVAFLFLKMLQVINWLTILLLLTLTIIISLA